MGGATRSEIWTGVTIAGQPNNRTNEQGKIGLLSQWTMEGWDEQYSWSCLKTSAVYVFVLIMAYVSKKEYPGALVRFGSKKDTRVARARKGMFGVLAPPALFYYGIQGGSRRMGKTKRGKGFSLWGSPMHVDGVRHPAPRFGIQITLYRRLWAAQTLVPMFNFKESSASSLFNINLA